MSDIDLQEQEQEDELPELARLLIDTGKISRAQMDAALAEQQTTGQSLARVLTERNMVSEADIVRVVASEVGMEFIDLNDYPVDRSITNLVPEAVARRHYVLPIGWEDGRPLVAVANPSDVFAMDDLRSVLGRDMATVMATKSQILEFINRLYQLDSEADTVAQTAARDSAFDDQVDLASIQAVVEDAPIVKYVNLIILQALNERASDIHVEPSADDLRIRFRIDGVLHEMTRSPRSITAGVVSRLKVMADINIAERRIPQDGRISLNANGREIDLRVATLPTVHGEKVVMRILDKTNTKLNLADLGFLEDILGRYEQAYTKPYGTILVTGPTGSGKSTTLYATMNILNNDDRNLITVEDPVEYQLPGINQVQVNPKAGLTFASALRSILRSDPDVVLVGEIRDRETAVIAVEAALTGHLVLSTLHTNDAASTPMRLVEMGVEPFLVTSALDCVLAQRLARLLCQKCKEPADVSTDALIAAGWPENLMPIPSDMTTFRPVGCQACARTGFRGRLALHEVLLMTEEIERLIISRAPSDEIKRTSLEQGMLPLRLDGLRKAAQGLTTIEEVLRVVA
ncbi:MAG TPA: ATPase, T2SS/T4P/T4SS family [Acidimicrobiales bacterium]|nr:ATPase, T2SS/T4P/T4SS family [Acidimicrobiales bacterium]